MPRYCAAAAVTDPSGGGGGIARSGAIEPSGLSLNRSRTRRAALMTRMSGSPRLHMTLTSSGSASASTWSKSFLLAKAKSCRYPEGMELPQAATAKTISSADARVTKGRLFSPCSLMDPNFLLSATLRPVSPTFLLSSIKNKNKNDDRHKIQGKKGMVKPF